MARFYQVFNAKREGRFQADDAAGRFCQRLILFFSAVRCMIGSDHIDGAVL